MSGRAWARADSAVDARLDTASPHSHANTPHQGLQAQLAGSFTVASSRSNVMESGLFTGSDYGLDGLPLLGEFGIANGHGVRCLENQCQWHLTGWPIAGLE